MQEMSCEEALEGLKKQIADLTAEITEHEEVIKAVKLDSAAIKEFSDRQAEEIAALTAALRNITAYRKEYEDVYEIAMEALCK